MSIETFGGSVTCGGWGARERGKLGGDAESDGSAAVLGDGRIACEGWEVSEIFGDIIRPGWSDSLSTTEGTPLRVAFLASDGASQITG